MDYLFTASILHKKRTDYKYLKYSPLKRSINGVKNPVLLSFFFHQ